METSSHPPLEAHPVLQFDPKDVADNKAVAALSYLWILVFIPLFLKKDSKYAQEHAKQGLIMFIAFIVGWLVFWIPVIGWLLWLVLAIADLYALVCAIQGKFWEVPLLGALRNKFNL
ncbi:hypothetical protein EXS71_01795 [Candidatus Uhrbacteria bacterium]|nr:hypothetical protein [Candidatus Uhrbacteria bacterium]